MNQVEEFLSAVKNKLSNPSNWTKRRYAQNKAGKTTNSIAPDACSWCLTGAISNIMGPEKLWNTNLSKIVNDSIICLHQSIPLFDNYPTTHFESINDHDEMTHEKLMSWLDKAIELAKFEVY